MKKISLVLIAALTLSCVSKKKYLALEHENGEIKSELQKTQIENDEFEALIEEIEQRVENYNAKIMSLKAENDTKLDVTDNGTVISNDAKVEMRETLKHVNPAKLSQAKTLKDSMNLAVSYNLEKAINKSDINDSDDLGVSVDGTVVMISIADDMLFNTGSYRISSKADAILQQIADLINSEPSLDVMVEGHTDSRSIKTDFIADNWDLSVLRATSVVRKLQDKFKVAPEQLIASGRSSYQPLVNNDTPENRAKNRRTHIIILPNIDKFFALMSDKE